MFPNTATKKKERASQKSQEQAQALSKVSLFFIWSFLHFFPSTNLKEQYHGKLRYMERTASLLVRDLSLSPCLITPGTNHGSVHSQRAVDQKKKRFILYYKRPSKTTLKETERVCKREA